MRQRLRRSALIGLLPALIICCSSQTEAPPPHDVPTTAPLSGTSVLPRQAQLPLPCDALATGSPAGANERIRGRVDIQNASFSGNAITQVQGSGQLTNQKGDTIADGKLTVVEGWVALPAIKGSQFDCFDSDLSRKLDIHWHGEPSAELAAVTLACGTRLRLDDERFLFLFDTSYGTQLDLAASLARASEIWMPNAGDIALWGSKISVGSRGGSVQVVRGRVVGGANIHVTDPDGKATAFK